MTSGRTRVGCPKVRLSPCHSDGKHMGLYQKVRQLLSISLIDVADFGYSEYSQRSLSTVLIHQTVNTAQHFYFIDYNDVYRFLI